MPLLICHSFLDLGNFLRMSKLKSPAPACTPCRRCLPLTLALKAQLTSSQPPLIDALLVSLGTQHPIPRHHNQHPLRVDTFLTPVGI